MKIGIDARSLEGQRTGVGRYLYNLLHYWNKSTSNFILYFKDKIPNDIPRTKIFKSKILKTNSNALFVHYFLDRAARKDKIDILFCPDYIAPIFYKGKTALTLHDIIYQARSDLYDWPSIFDKILLKKFSYISAKKADIIFTPSKFCKDEIIKHFKIRSEKIFVTPLAVDDRFRLVKNKAVLEKIKREYKIKDKFIFYIGSIFKRRFIPETIKGFAKTVDKLPNYQFLIIGKNYIEQKIKGQGIIHINHIKEEDLPLLYNAADLFIWLSSYEGFGLPPLEAMACGTPVITTKMGSLPEAVGIASLFVNNPEDVYEISEKIYKGLTNKNLRKKLIEKGLKQVKKFSWQKTAEETLKILIHEK
jgi:glycosyltransferase involved in cell wall biosynthesis